MHQTKHLQQKAEKEVYQPSKDEHTIAEPAEGSVIAPKEGVLSPQIPC